MRNYRIFAARKWYTKYSWGDYRSPLLLLKIMFKEQVAELLERALEKRKDLFLLDFTVGSDHGIKIVLVLKCLKL